MAKEQLNMEVTSMTQKGPQEQKQRQGGVWKGTNVPHWHDSQTHRKDVNWKSLWVPGESRNLPPVQQEKPKKGDDVGRVKAPDSAGGSNPMWGKRHLTGGKIDQIQEKRGKGNNYIWNSLFQNLEGVENQGKRGRGPHMGKRCSSNNY